MSIQLAALRLYQKKTFAPFATFQQTRLPPRHGSIRSPQVLSAAHFDRLSPSHFDRLSAALWGESLPPSSPHDLSPFRTNLSQSVYICYALAEQNIKARLQAET